jgi:uncharacterized damage-inducible protein DinB
MTLEEQLLDSWRIANRINLYFLDNVPPDALHGKAEKGKSVAGQFSHIHSVRLMWIKASAPDLMEELAKIEDSAPVEELKAALDASARTVEKLVERGLAEGKIKNFKPHPAAFVGYLIAHEANHRGQAELILRQLGSPIPDKASYGLWEWGSR